MWRLDVLSRSILAGSNPGDNLEAFLYQARVRESKGPKSLLLTAKG